MGAIVKNENNDLNILFSFMKNRSKTIVCDDYMDVSYITESKNRRSMIWEKK